MCVRVSFGGCPSSFVWWLLFVMIVLVCCFIRRCIACIGCFCWLQLHLQLHIGTDTAISITDPSSTRHTRTLSSSSARVVLFDWCVPLISPARTHQPPQRKQQPGARFDNTDRPTNCQPNPATRPSVSQSVSWLLSDILDRQTPSRLIQYLCSIGQYTSVSHTDTFMSVPYRDNCVLLLLFSSWLWVVPTTSFG